MWITLHYFLHKNKFPFVVCCQEREERAASIICAKCNLDVLILKSTVATYTLHHSNICTGYILRLRILACERCFKFSRKKKKKKKKEHDFIARRAMTHRIRFNCDLTAFSKFIIVAECFEHVYKHILGWRRWQPAWVVVIVSRVDLALIPL